jgi:hypothetical protein
MPFPPGRKLRRRLFHVAVLLSFACHPEQGSHVSTAFEAFWKVHLTRLAHGGQFCEYVFQQLLREAIASCSHPDCDSTVLEGWWQEA